MRKQFKWRSCFYGYFRSDGGALHRYFGMHLFQDRPVGDLRVDHSDPVDGPHLYLELDTDVSAILRKKRVAFRVKAKDFIPHE